MRKIRRISTFLTVVISIGVLTVGAWVYQKYFRGHDETLVTETAARRDLEEVVHVRGEVVAERDFTLGFLSSGIVADVFVAEGDLVAAGARLMALNIRDLELEAGRLEAVLVQRRATLDKLRAGYTKEDIRITETKVQSALVAETAAVGTLITELKNALAVSDNAIRNKVDPLFTNPRTSSPQLTVPVNDTQLEINVESGRVAVEQSLASWSAAVAAATGPDDIPAVLFGVNADIDALRGFLDKLSLAVNSIQPGGSVTQAMIDTWKADVAAARTNISTSASSIAAAKEKWDNAAAARALAEDELRLKTAGTRPEDIAVAAAQVREIESELASLGERMRKATITAPDASRIVKLYVKKGETFIAGGTAVSVSTAAQKIQADVSELEIGRLREGGEQGVRIELDAFPGEQLSGALVSIDPQEIVKDDDKYYRVNIRLNPADVIVRAGMSADLDIVVSVQKNVVVVPDYAVTRRDGKKFVTVLAGKTTRETEIETGVTDGEAVEVTAGLSGGETVVISAE